MICASRYSNDTGRAKAGSLFVKEFGYVLLFILFVSRLWNLQIEVARYQGPVAWRGYISAVAGCDRAKTLPKH